MKKFINDLTVFVITTDKSINYEDCIEALKNQSVGFKLFAISNYHPMSKAFQQMINQCQTPYYVQVDDDMILYPNAIEDMYNAIIKSRKEISMVAFMLKDVHLNFPICGVKIYKHDIFKKYPYNLSCLSCEVEQTDRMKRDGYTFITKQKIVGDHSPNWTDETIFERYYNLMEKYKEFKYNWLERVPLKLWNILKKNPTKNNLYALLGAYTSIIKEEIEHKEKDYTLGKKKELIRMETFMNDDKKLNVVKVIDQWGWAYYYLGKEQQKFTRHNIILQKYTEFNMSLDDVDVIYFHGPDMAPRSINDELIQKCKDKGIPVIGGYGGLVSATYQYADVIATISPETYNYAKEKYDCPTIFLPESVDTDYFKSNSSFNSNRFNVGYAGSPIPLKRTYLFDKLNFPVIQKSDWGQKFWVQQTQDHMKNFYQSIDVLILLSITECIPRVVLEAMAMGLPVVATNVGCLSMLLDKEWIVDANPEKEVVKQANEKLNILFKNPILRRDVGIRNRWFVEENFSWKKTQPLWDDFFDIIYCRNHQMLENFPNYMLKFKA